MDCRPVLEDPLVEDGKAVKKTACSFITFEWVCESIISNSLFCAMDLLNPLGMKRMAPSQAADVRALLRVMLWFGVAGAAAAVLALRQPAGRRRLALAFVALASTVATHCIRMLLCHLIITRADESLYYLIGYFIVAVGAIFFTVTDLLAFVVLLRGAGAEEEK